MEQVSFEISGGGPFGFRLYGGENDPLVIAKLRKRSKAHEALMQEGDILLSINGRSCKGMSHGSAMSLVDASASQLRITALRPSDCVDTSDTCCQFCGVSKRRNLMKRGSTDPSALNAAYQSVGSSPQVAKPSSIAHKIYQNPSQPMEINGSYQPGRSYKREEQTTREGDSTKTVTTETTQESFGGSTVTKVRRQEVTSYAPGVQPLQQKQQAQPAQQGFAPPMPALFQVSSAAPKTQKQATWSPSGAPAKKPTPVTFKAPSGVQAQQNPDQSITLTLGFPRDATGIQPTPKENKENAAPMFKVSKVSANTTKPGAWQPTTVPTPVRAPEPQPPPEPQHVQEEPEPFYSHDPNTAPIWSTPPVSEPQTPKLKSVPLHLQRILIEGPGSGDECPDSPGMLLRQNMGESFERPSKLIDKKLYGDSAFYDDPEHKYPTIEEQIKMARNVAMSLLSPRNQEARGYKMFVKRATKADKWSTDHPGGPATQDSDEEREELPYQENVQKPSHTWQPSGNPGPVAPIGIRDGIVPQPPPLPENMFSTPTLPKLKKKDTSAMSAEEIERMRLFEQKNPHTGVAPATCFSLADELKTSSGRGAKLFAKRKERAKKWVVNAEGEEEEETGPDPEFLKKIGAVPAMPGMGMPMPGMGMPLPVLKKKEPAKQGPPVNRLKDMIDPPKPKMTPWDAAAQYQGCTDKAFEHLIGYRPHGSSNEMNDKVADNLQKAVQLQEQKPAAEAKNLWTPATGGGTSPGSTISMSTSMTSSKTSESPFNRGGATAPRGFKPIGFKSPIAPTNNTGPAPWSSASSVSSNASFHSGGGDFRGRPVEAGVCDL